MAKLMEIYKCEICGNIIEVVHGGPGKLVCCNKEMKLFEEQTADSTTEKHVPVMERTGDLVKVTVGSVPHPMADAHYVEWIEIVGDGRMQRKHLKPGEEPVALFLCRSENLVAREYCNVHGLWRA